jgi:hypothetical protein
MFDTFSCPTLADYASGGKPPVPITQGELCSQVVKDLLTTDFENLRIADFLSPTSTCNASLVVTGLGTSSDVGDATAYMLPFPLDFKTTAATCMPAPEMDYRCDIAMWNSGHCDAWNTARAPGFGMSHFNRSELPFYFALADAFTVGDQYFQSTYTATSPNREHLFSGSNGLSIGDGKFNLLDDSAPDGMEVGDDGRDPGERQCQLDGVPGPGQFQRQRVRVVRALQEGQAHGPPLGQG